MHCKTDLTDVTFIIPVRLDSVDRLENILAITQYLCSNFETNIWVSEYASYNNCILKKLLHKKIQYTFTEDQDPVLYRTRFLNQMIRVIDKEFVAVWDTDVIIQKNQILKAVELLRSGSADFVYPYENLFFDTSPIMRKLYLQKRRIEILELNATKMKALYQPNPVGGAFIANMNSYKAAGLENENFYGWGPEDHERFHRWENKGFKIKRVQGPLFHLSHTRGVNSTYRNTDQLRLNRKEISDIRRKKNIDSSYSTE